jgi:hypothetical protein
VQERDGEAPHSTVAPADALLSSFPRKRDETELGGPPPRGQRAPSSFGGSTASVGYRQCGAASPVRTAIAHPSPCVPTAPSGAPGGVLRGRAFGRSALRKLAKKLNHAPATATNGSHAPRHSPLNTGGPLGSSSISADSFKLRFSHSGAVPSASSMADDREAPMRRGHRRRSSYVGLFDEQLSFITPSTSESEYLGAGGGAAQAHAGARDGAVSAADAFNARNEPHSFAGWRSRPLYTPESSSVGSSDCGELAKASAGALPSSAIAGAGVQIRSRRRGTAPLPKPGV